MKRFKRQLKKYHLGIELPKEYSLELAQASAKRAPYLPTTMALFEICNDLASKVEDLEKKNKALKEKLEFVMENTYKNDDFMDGRVVYKTLADRYKESNKSNRGINRIESPY